MSLPVGSGLLRKGKFVQEAEIVYFRARQLKSIMHISSNPLARKPVIPRIAPENLRSIGPRITENCPIVGKCDFILDLRGCNLRACPWQQYGRSVMYAAVVV